MLLSSVSNSIAKGQMEPDLWKKMTGYPDFIKYSADLAPLVPVLKFSRVAPLPLSRGTDVPPLVMKMTGLSFKYSKLL